MTRRLFGAGVGEAVLRADEYRLLRDLVSERLGIWFGLGLVIFVLYSVRHAPAKAKFSLDFSVKK